MRSITKNRIRLLIPLLVVTFLQIKCILQFMLSEAKPEWQHYLGIVLYCCLVYFFFKKFRLAVVSTGIYLLLSTFAVISNTPEISTSWFTIGPIDTPHINFPSFGLLILFLILNLDQLIEIYLDYKEGKAKLSSDE